MIKILLVDDDVLVLTKIKQLIKYIKGDYEVVKAVTNAKEAMDFLKQQEVDILITDMKMPKVDGINLIKEIRTMDKPVQIIAISSYEDFYYVKESLKQGSLDYILKHNLNEKVLKNVLEGAQKKIIAKRNLELSQIEHNKIIRESKELLKKELLEQLLYGYVNRAEALEKFKDYKIELSLNNLILITCEIDNYKVITEDFSKKDERIFNDAAIDIIKRVLDKVDKKEILSLNEGEYIIYLSFDQVKSNLYILSTASEYAERVKSNLEKLLNLKISISISNCCNDIADIPKYYLKSKEKLKNKFYEGKGKVYDVYDSGAVSGIKNITKDIKINEKEFLEKLRRGNEELLRSIELLFDKYKEAKYPFELVELSVLEMFNIGNEVIKEYNMDIDLEKYSLNHLYKNIYKYETLEDIKQLMLSFYSTILSKVKEKNKFLDNRYSKYTIKCISYIEGNYGKQISLQNAADFIGVNAAYLSKVFKNDVSKNFVEFLNNYRVEKAKELIQMKSYKIKEISELVGFNNYNYFFKVFKQITDVTPLEFEKNIKKL